MPRIVWAILLGLIAAGTIWGLSRLPRRRKKGEEPFTIDGGPFSSG